PDLPDVYRAPGEAREDRSQGVDVYRLRVRAALVDFPEPGGVPVDRVVGRIGDDRLDAGADQRRQDLPAVPVVDRDVLVLVVRRHSPSSHMPSSAMISRRSSSSAFSRSTWRRRVFGVVISQERMDDARTTYSAPSSVARRRSESRVPPLSRYAVTAASMRGSSAGGTST